MRYKKDLVVILLIGLMIFIVVVNNPVLTGNVVSNQASNSGGVSSGVQIQQIPLNAEEREKVAQTILSSDFIKDVPEKNPIALTFYSFENGQRVLRGSFLIGNNQLLSDGTPAIFLSLHSKYISEFNGQNLCQVIKKAKTNGDLGFNSDYSKTKLFIKYAKMLKHRECFGV